MRISRIAVASLTACALVTVGVLLPRIVRPPTPDGVDAVGLIRALSDYAADIRDRGQEVPSVIALDALVRSGHLEADEARKWDGVQISFYRDASETRPRSVVVQAVLLDGSGIALLGDGSVQQLTRTRMKSLNEQHGE